MGIPVNVSLVGENGQVEKGTTAALSPIKSIRRKKEVLHFYDGDGNVLVAPYEDIVNKENTSNAQELLEFYSLNKYFSSGGGVALPIAQSDVTGLEGRLNTIEGDITDIQVSKKIAIWYEAVTITDSSDGASGTLTPPTGGAIQADGWGTGGLQGIILQVKNGRPVLEAVEDTDPLTIETFVAVALDLAGNYTIAGQLSSGSPSVSAAIVYKYLVNLEDYDPLQDIHIPSVFEPVIGALIDDIATSGNDITYSVDKILSIETGLQNQIDALQTEQDKLRPLPTVDGAYMLVSSGGNLSWEAGVFESLVDEFISDAPQTITSTAPVQKLSGNTVSLPVGDYVLRIMYSWNKNSTTQDIITRLNFDGSFQSPTFSDELHRQEPKDAGGGNEGGTGTNQKYGFYHEFNIQVTSAGVKPLFFDFASSVAGNETSIWLCKAKLYRKIG